MSNKPSKKVNRRKPPKRRGGVPWTLVFTVVVLAAVVAVIVAQPKPIQLVQATTIGAVAFPAGDTAQGGQGAPVDAISCNTTEQLVYHIHAHLSLYVNGRQLAVPMGIGIVPPRQVTQHFVTGGKCFYWLHTHDNTGIIHIESPIQKDYTLGDFFDIWGRPLSTTDLVGHKGPVTVFVDGKRYTGNPRNILLTAHKQIALETGSPVVTPPTYTFPAGL